MPGVADGTPSGSPEREVSDDERVDAGTEIAVEHKHSGAIGRERVENAGGVAEVMFEGQEADVL
jgi:hypothetical protein